MDGETLEQTCKRLEHYETPRWAADSILNREMITPSVVDPCCGTGVLTEAAIAAGATDIQAFDIHDYGYRPNVSVSKCQIADWFDVAVIPNNSTILTNPPFSRAVEFIEHAFVLGARKVICFQRFAWWESKRRADFWTKHPPNRVYVCGDRADCWRHDILEHERTSGTTTAHAWYIWEKGHPPGTILGHIRKSDAK